MWRFRSHLGFVGVVLFLVAWLNCAAFVLIGLTLGGPNSHVEDGRYYLTDHGTRTEVSRKVWAYSRAHQRSVDITHPIGMFVGGGLIIYAIRSKPDDRTP